MSVASPATIEAEFWTDPLCAWSAALWPQWQRLVAEMAERLRWRLRLGAMIRDWQTFDDPFHAVSRPAQTGKVLDREKSIFVMAECFGNVIHGCSTAGCWAIRNCGCDFPAGLNLCRN